MGCVNVSLGLPASADEVFTESKWNASIERRHLPPTGILRW